MIKSILLCSSVLFWTLSFAQYEVELDTQINVYSVDPVDTSIPSNYNVTVVQRIKYKSVFFICNAKPKFRGSTVGNIPDSCSKWQVIEKIEKHGKTTLGVIQNDSTFVQVASKTGNIEIGDTVWTGIDLDCMYSFYSELALQDTVDTIMVNSNFSQHDLSELILSNCDYYYNVKHNYETVYYSYKEMHDENGFADTRSQIKFEGWWKEGKKHGKWKYWDKEGNLIREEKYKKGKLVKTKLRE